VSRCPRTARRQAVSGLFHSPHRGAFHLSLTVLVHYRSPCVLAPWRVVSPASHGVSRHPRYSAHHLPGHVRASRLRGSHPLCPALPGPFASAVVFACSQDPCSSIGSSVMATTPRPHIGLPSTQWHRVWARAPVRSPLLGDFLPVPRGTKMFQFPRFPSHALPPAPPQRATPGSRSSGILVYDHKGIAPFGDRRIIGRSHLPVAFRRLLRPSSAHGAKASTACRLPPLASHRSRAPHARPRLRRRLPRDQKHGSRHPHHHAACVAYQGERRHFLLNTVCTTPDPVSRCRAPLSLSLSVFVCVGICISVGYLYDLRSRAPHVTTPPAQGGQRCQVRQAPADRAATPRPPPCGETRMRLHVKRSTRSTITPSSVGKVPTPSSLPKETAPAALPARPPHPTLPRAQRGTGGGPENTGNTAGRDGWRVTGQIQKMQAKMSRTRRASRPGRPRTRAPGSPKGERGQERHSLERR